MKENCASFLGPLIDSSRYAVVNSSESLEKISRGFSWTGNFLKHRVLASLVDVSVIVGVCAPKAIPHFYMLLWFRCIRERII